MRVLYQSRVDLYNPRGGDTFQMEHTKMMIEKLYPSIQIDILPEVKVKDIKKYDLVHLFNLDWICETYLQVKHAKKHNIPVVLSAIHHSEKEVKRYEREDRYDFRRIYNAIIPYQPLRDVAKNVYRSTLDRKFKKLYPTFIQLIKGIKKQQREIIKNVDMVLVQTKAEAKDIREDFKVKKFKWEKVVNGVSIDTFINARNDNLSQKSKMILMWILLIHQLY